MCVQLLRIILQTFWNALTVVERVTQTSFNTRKWPRNSSATDKHVKKTVTLTRGQGNVLKINLNSKLND